MCECGHLDVFHDIRRDRTRTACSISTGPQATPCGCRTYRPRKEDT